MLLSKHTGAVLGRSLSWPEGQSRGWWVNLPGVVRIKHTFMAEISLLGKILGCCFPPPKRSLTCHYLHSDDSGLWGDGG